MVKIVTASSRISSSMLSQTVNSTTPSDYLSFLRIVQSNASVKIPNFPFWQTSTDFHIYSVFLFVTFSDREVSDTNNFPH